MLKVVSDKAAIKRYAALFNKQFKPYVDEAIKIRLGHQGASFPAKVSWSKKLGVWKFSKTVKDVRYWNAFGVEKPGGHVLSIAAEINFPWQAIDRKIGGAFAEDHWGNVFVIHRGKIGGGKKGIGKSLFEQNYRGVWAWMEDGDAVSEVAVIGHLQSDRFALQAAQFVKKIERLKLFAAESAQVKIDFAEVCFREDLVGSETPLPEEEIVFVCDHDLVVNALAIQLQRQRMKIGNDAKNELFAVVSSEKRISHLFEIVTDPKERNVMTAVGKLLLQPSGAEPVLVLPEDKVSHYGPELQRVNISTIGFRWEAEKVVFSGRDLIRMTP
jgi:hypothetical protein